MRLIGILSSVALAACGRGAVPGQVRPRAQLEEGSGAPATAPDAQVAALPLDAAAAQPVCEPRPAPPATASCPGPGAEVLQRVEALLSQVSLPASHGGWEAGVRYGCELAQGWFVSAQFMPASSFYDGDVIPCPPAAGEGVCGATATWLVPGRGAVQLQRGVWLVDNLDVDGDGRAETITYRAGETTVWFDAGRKPVQTRQPGRWQPWQRGHVLLQIDGDAARGFVVETARAFRVTPGGIAEAQDVIAPLWQETVAARCPVASVIAPDEPAGFGLAPMASGVHGPCGGPGAAIEAKLSAQMLEAITARQRARAMLIADGPPRFSWSCNRRHLAALVTYCEGEAAAACTDERGTWIHEVWVGRDGTMKLLERHFSGSVLGEWSVNGNVGIVGQADVDGDGEPDAILDEIGCEGGAMVCGHHYKALVAGATLPIASLVATKEADTSPRAVRMPGTAIDAVVLLSTASSGTPGETNPAGAWSLQGGKMQPMAGPPKLDVLKRAR